MSNCPWPVAGDLNEAVAVLGELTAVAEVEIDADREFEAYRGGGEGYPEPDVFCTAGFEGNDLGGEEEVEGKGAEADLRPAL